jgi:zinc protease
MSVLSRVLMCLLGAAVALVAEGPRKIFPYAYEQRDFSNGLRLVTIPTDYPNVVSVFIVVQTGSRNEVEPGKSGFAHLFEHLMFRGTPSFSPAKYEATLKAAGAASNAYTTDDHTAYHTTFSKEDLETVLRMEADRFEHLEYSPEVFRTETLAVLGEYNKNSANPATKLFEALRDTAFDRHTYKHTTMGFLRDVEDMPNQFEYSRTFFDRYYRPEYTTLVVVGDVTPEATRALVEKYWGGWKRGDYRPEILAEPPQNGARTKQVAWPTTTLPWVAVSFRAPRYSDQEKDQAALDLIAFLGFAGSSELYQRLVIEEQKVDTLRASSPDHVDPYLFTAFARVKKDSDVDSVRDAILATAAGFKDQLVPAARLDAVKRHLRYAFALGLDDSEAIAATVARYVALRRTPETINRLYEVYDTITPEDIRAVARKYFADDSRTIVTLAGGKSK